MKEGTEEKKEIIITISKNKNIVHAIQKALETNHKKYITIKPSELQTIQSTQEGTFIAETGTIRNIAG